VRNFPTRDSGALKHSTGRASACTLETPQVSKKPPGAAKRSKETLVRWVSRGAPHRVLLVEDNDDAREMYGAHFHDTGWEVEGVAGAEDAVAIAAVFEPGVIVMDLAMPGVSGIDAIVELKRDPRTRHIPIIVLTAYPDREVDALKAGCDAFLAKPCPPDEVLSVARSILRRRSGKIVRPSEKPPKRD